MIYFVDKANVNELATNLDRQKTMSDKKKIEYKSLIHRMWNDQVLSQLISVGLLSLLTLLYSFFVTIFKNISFQQALIDTLTFKLELYKILIFIAVVVTISILIYKWQKKRNKKIGKFDVEQKVGNFTFRELYNALLTHKINTPSYLMGAGTENKTDLLVLFILYQRQLNLGSEWEHDHFTHYILGPTLMTYGLTEKAPTTNKLDSIGSDMIQTSKVGYEFYALLERWRVYNDEIMKDDVTKTDTEKPKTNPRPVQTNVEGQ